MKASWTFYYADVLIIPNKFAASWNPDKQQGHNNFTATVTITGRSS